MKETKILHKFKCDKCEEETKEELDSTPFPYDKGWRYLYNLNFKINSRRNISIKDKHFCSVKCMIKYIIDNINEWESSLNKENKKLKKIAGRNGGKNEK